jgi:hypothetical protein
MWRNLRPATHQLHSHHHLFFFFFFWCGCKHFMGLVLIRTHSMSSCKLHFPNINFLMIHRFNIFISERNLWAYISEYSSICWVLYLTQLYESTWNLLSSTPIGFFGYFFTFALTVMF